MDADVAIIGGGPGGSVAGAKLAQNGVSTIILEREHFPRFHIGESLLPVGNNVLQEVGVLPKVAQAGFRKKHGARFCDPGYRYVKRISFGDALGSVPSFTYQVERAKYDSLLLDHARSCGCQVRHGVKVESFKEDSDGVTLQCKGEEKPIRVRWVLDASGRDCVSVRQLGARKQLMPGFNRRIAIYTHLSNVELSPGEAGGDTVAVRFDDGWVWIIPLDDEKTSVGLVLDISSYDKSRKPEDIYWSKLRTSPYLTQILRNSRSVEQFHVTADYSYFYEPPITSGRVLPLGDAFGFLDPIFSSGVYLAESGGLDAAKLVLTHHAAGTALTPRERAHYEKKLRNRATAFRKLIEAFYDPVSFRVFLDPGGVFRIADAVTNIVAGDADCSFSVLWRYYCFLAICKLQRRIPISKSARDADFSGTTPASACCSEDLR